MQANNIWCQRISGARWKNTQERITSVIQKVTSRLSMSQVVNSYKVNGGNAMLT